MRLGIRRRRWLLCAALISIAPQVRKGEHVVTGKAVAMKFLSVRVMIVLLHSASHSRLAEAPNWGI